MELTQLNNFDVNYSSVDKTKELSQSNETREERSEINKSDIVTLSDESKIDHTLQTKLSTSIDQLSSINVLQNGVKTQINILSEIEAIMEIPTTTTQLQHLDKVQPQVSNLMQNFNLISNYTNIKNTQNQDENESRSYFDGKLGAKPLSSAEIYEAVLEQKARMSQVQASYQKIEDNTTRVAKQSIQAEKETIQANSTDFKKESENFSSASVLKLEGSLSKSQANISQNSSYNLLT